MSGYFNFATLVAFILGVLLSMSVKGAFSSVKSKVGA